jgi:phosphoglycolate phosphatase-like HAD superfamily hydrolase
MVRKAMRDLGFDAGQAVVIGDSDADMGAAEAAGVPGVRVAGPGGSASAAHDFLEAARRARTLVT